MYSKEELALIWIDSFDFLDYKRKSLLFDAYGENESLKSAISMLEGDKGFDGEKLIKLRSSLNEKYLKQLTDELDKNDITAITVSSEDYPEKLRALNEPPLVLYAKGDLNLLESTKSVAVVGSRQCLPIAKEEAKKYASFLAEAGFTIVTGIAEGVDENVIKGALDSGKIISVTAGGFDCVYPKENEELFKSVARKGLVLSEQPLGVSPMSYDYPVRNRIIAALSDAVVVISAKTKSGALHTVNYALDMGKEVFAMPYNVNVASGEGCNRLIKSGAFLTDSPEDIASYFGVETTVKKAELTEEEQAIYDVIKEEGNIHIDKLCEVLKKPSYELLPLLSMMELKGILSRDAGNYFSCIE